MTLARPSAAAYKQWKDTRDLRDPQKLGTLLIELTHHHNTGTLRRAYDSTDTSSVERYNANPSTLEKYGRPQDRPTTPW